MHLHIFNFDDFLFLNQHDSFLKSIFHLGHNMLQMENYFRIISFYLLNFWTIIKFNLTVKFSSFFT